MKSYLEKLEEYNHQLVLENKRLARECNAAENFDNSDTKEDDAEETTQTECADPDANVKECKHQKNKNVDMFIAEDDEETEIVDDDSDEIVNDVSVEITDTSDDEDIETADDADDQAADDADDQAADDTDDTVEIADDTDDTVEIADDTDDTVEIADDSAADDDEGVENATPISDEVKQQIIDLGVETKESDGRFSIRFDSEDDPKFVETLKILSDAGITGAVAVTDFGAYIAVGKDGRDIIIAEDEIVEFNAESDDNDMNKLTPNEKHFLSCFEEGVYYVYDELDAMSTWWKKDDPDAWKDCENEKEIWDALNSDKTPDEDKICRIIAGSTSDFMYDNDRYTEKFYNAIKSLLEKKILKFDGKGKSLRLLCPDYEDIVGSFDEITESDDNDMVEITEDEETDDTDEVEIASDEDNEEDNDAEEDSVEITDNKEDDEIEEDSVEIANSDDGDDDDAEDADDDGDDVVVLGGELDGVAEFFLKDDETEKTDDPLKDENAVLEARKARAAKRIRENVLMSRDEFFKNDEKPIPESIQTMLKTHKKLFAGK